MKKHDDRKQVVNGSFSIGTNTFQEGFPLRLYIDLETGYLVAVVKINP